MSRTITVRVATTNDELALSVLIGASYRLLANGGYDRTALAAALPPMSRANPKLLSPGTYYVAEEADQAVGCGGWTFEAPGTGTIVPGVAHVRHFATHPAHLRKGVARLLMERCLAEAHSAGATLMKCQSTLPGERFYASTGFRRVGSVDVTLAPGVALPAVAMERPLP